MSLVRNRAFAVVLMIAVLASSSSPAADSVEFLNGSKVSGTIKSIRKADKEFDFETTIGTRTFLRVYPFGKVHAVVYQGKRFVLTPKAGASKSGSASGKKSSALSRSEVLAIIDSAGETPPDWFESTPLNYPKSLDLSWPLKPPTKGWQANKNMGQYIWSVINENPSRWRSGIKLLHHCVSLHKDDPVLLTRDMKALGSAYFRLLQDYERAAFWYQKAKVTVNQLEGVRLAECYWRLGNKAMALSMLRGKSVHISAIKLYGDLGEYDRAISLTDAFARGGADYQAYILAGDALRQAGRLDDAIEYYQKVVSSKRFRNEEYKKRFVARAKESIETIRLFDQADVSKVSDGTYRGSSTGYNGKLTVEVSVADGKMTSVKVVKHLEKQFYSSLTDTPRQLIARQSVQGIDGTTSATITSQAIVNATAKALAGQN